MGKVSINSLRAKRDGPDISDDEGDEQAGHVLGQANEAVVPMPTTAFEVTEGLFLPVAAGILVTGQARVIGDQCPGFSIAW